MILGNLSLNPSQSPPKKSKKASASKGKSRLWGPRPCQVSPVRPTTGWSFSFKSSVKRETISLGDHWGDHWGDHPWSHKLYFSRLILLGFPWICLDWTLLELLFLCLYRCHTAFKSKAEKKKTLLLESTSLTHTQFIRRYEKGVLMFQKSFSFEGKLMRNCKYRNPTTAMKMWWHVARPNKSAPTIVPVNDIETPLKSRLVQEAWHSWRLRSWSCQHHCAPGHHELPSTASCGGRHFFRCPQKWQVSKL